MKAINYIAVLALLVLGSCTSGLYTGIEYDDLYFLPSDQKVARAAKPATTQIVEGNLKGQDYYDNIYAADTLVSDEYTDAIDFNQALVDQNYGSNYYGFDSYSGRLSRFHGNYFNPYWRDPFYYSMGFPSMSYGFGRYPYYYDPFYDDYGYGFGNPYSYYGYGNPYSYYGGYNGGYYGGYYGSYYGGYSPFSNWGLYPNYNIREQNSLPYARRERQSTYSTSWNKNIPVSSVARRDGTMSQGARSSSSNSTMAVDRRNISNTASSKETLNPSTVKSQNAGTPMSRSEVRSSTASRPEYNNVNRTYTPSYNNPRMSTRPSYNNSRTGSESVSTKREPTSYTPAARSSYGRNSSSVSSSQTRSSSSYSNPGSSYSSPSRSGTGSSYSSGSGSRSSSGSSSGDYSRSYSSGSSSSGSSGSSYSSGSSGGGGGDSRSGGGNSGSDSGGRR